MSALELIQALKDRHTAEIIALKDEHRTEKETLVLQYSSLLQTAKKIFDDHVIELQKHHTTEAQDLKAFYEEELERLRAQNEAVFKAAATAQNQLSAETKKVERLTADRAELTFSLQQKSRIHQ